MVRPWSSWCEYQLYHNVDMSENIPHKDTYYVIFIYCKYISIFPLQILTSRLSVLSGGSGVGGESWFFWQATLFHSTEMAKMTHTDGISKDYCDHTSLSNILQCVLGLHAVKSTVTDSPNIACKGRKG